MKLEFTLLARTPSRPPYRVIGFKSIYVTSEQFTQDDTCDYTLTVK